MKPPNEICPSARVARTLMLGCTLIAIANLEGQRERGNSAPEVTPTASAARKLFARVDV